jgi:hypothetical protein
MRLEFAGSIAVAMSRVDFEQLRDTTEWLIEFPAGSLRAL